MLTVLASIALALPDVDAPLRTGASSAGAAVVVGIEDYAFLPDVDHAARDARAVYHTLVYTRGLPPERVQLLGGANREQILDAVGRARALGGPVVVYFAGHGAAAADTGELMLVGDDAKRDPAVFQARSVRLSELTEAVGPGGTAILDTCHAGRSRGGEELLDGVRFAVPTWAQPASSTAVWTAAGPDELSEAYPAAQHGLFTYFAVGAMRGWADGELSGAADGVVTLSEAQAYVSRALAAVRPGGQQPTATGSAELVRGAGLEAPPDLAALPVVGVQPAPVAPSGDFVFVAPAPVPAALPFAPPLSIVDRRIADAQGRAVPLSVLAAATSGQLDADRAVRRYSSAQSARLYGASAALTGVIGAATLIGLSGGVPAGSDATTIYVLGGTGALGIGAFTWGSLVAGDARRDVVEAANEALAE